MLSACVRLAATSCLVYLSITATNLAQAQPPAEGIRVARLVKHRPDLLNWSQEELQTLQQFQDRPADAESATSSHIQPATP